MERGPGELVDIALDGGWWEAEVALDDGDEVAVAFAGAEQSLAREDVRTRVQWLPGAGGAAAGHWEAVLAPPHGGHALWHLLCMQSLGPLCCMPFLRAWESAHLTGCLMGDSMLTSQARMQALLLFRHWMCAPCWQEGGGSGQNKLRRGSPESRLLPPAARSRPLTSTQAC